MTRLLAAAAVAAAFVPAAAPPPPARWPARTLELGLTSQAGDAAALRRSAPFGFRYQYLAGGVNTGNGWATWNPGGSFVTRYIAESSAAGMTPVFSYYMLLQSKPGGGDEAHADLANLRNPQTMGAYWRDLRLFFERARGARPVVLHVEPDLWGYVEASSGADDARRVPAVVPDGFARNVAGFARAIVALRDRLAPNVLLAYHLSIWGTGVDVSISDPPDAEVDRLAVRAARFYRSLGARFDLAFAEFDDRDSAFERKIQGQGPEVWWGPADFRRHARFLGRFSRETGLRIVLWQIPLGNTLMRAMDDTWGHFQDNRVQWLLGAESRAHLAAYMRAGVIALLFGGGAEGTTCACDARHDGVTNPPPIDGNTRRSLSADDDGGYFRARAAAYYRRGALRLR